jgi:DNA-directed RNA polymerase specialized sigma24 family protein
VPGQIDIHETVNAVYLSESRRVLATLIRLLDDFDAAEEALHDAFRAALEQWPRDGIPANPRAWLVSAGRFKAIDSLRRRKRFDALAANTAPGLARTPPRITPTKSEVLPTEAPIIDPSRAPERPTTTRSVNNRSASMAVVTLITKRGRLCQRHEEPTWAA